MATAQRVGKVHSAGVHDAVIPVSSVKDISFDYSTDLRLLRVMFPVGGDRVVLELSRSAAIGLAERVAARVPGMAEPVVPAQVDLSSRLMATSWRGGLR